MTIELVLWTAYVMKDGKSHLKIRLTSHNKPPKYYPLNIFVNKDHLVSGVITSDDKDYRTYNKQITEALDQFEELRKLNPSFNAIQLIQLYEKSTVPQVEKLTLIAFIKKFINDCKVNKSRKPNTIKAYNVSLGALEKFYKVRTFDYDDINITFYKDFKAFCLNTLKFSEGTFGDKIKHLKLFLNEAFENGHTITQEHKSRKFKTIREEADNIALTEEEVQLMYNLDLSDRPELDNERDRFILCCCMGLRYSDSIRIKPEHIIKYENNCFFKIKAEKTEDFVIIPLNKMALTILKKHKFYCPPSTTNQQSNRFLKTIGLLAGINSPIIVFESGKEKTVPQYTQIKTHTGRRTFATNAYLAGVDPFVIMKITGHKDLKSFLRYIRIDKLKNAQLAAKHVFFN